MNDSQLQPLDATLPGTVLAAPVTDANGAVLLSAGLALTEAHLDSLRRRGMKTSRWYWGAAVPRVWTTEPRFCDLTINGTRPVV